MFHLKGHQFTNLKRMVLLFWKITSYLSNKYNECNIFRAGDFNARTKNLLDYIYDDNLDYIYQSLTEYNSDNFDMPRNNKDNKHYNLFCISIVELCCTHYLHILNGRMFDDNSGNYTCIANGGHSVVDYYIASSDLFKNISYFNIENNDISDHFPVYTQFRFVCGNNELSGAYGTDHDDSVPQEKF